MFETKDPDRPLPKRVSSKRTGGTGLYVAPLPPATKYPLTSTMRCVVAPPVPDLKNPATLPAVSSLIVTLLARLSPVGKLSVELVGVVVGVGVSETYPLAVWPATVTLAVTAMAFAGMVPTPATWNERGVPDTNLLVRPTPLRVSSTRRGVIVAYVAPSNMRAWADRSS